MEQNVQVMAKKLWHIVRVAFFMLRKGICKGKILMDLSMMFKRGKIAGKALGNLMFHHHHHGNHRGNHQSTTADHHPGEYEFSCSNTPLYTHYFTNHNKRKNSHVASPFYYSCYDDSDNSDDIEAVNKAVEMMVSGNDAAVEVVVGSPAALPWMGFGRSSPSVRQLRITDSPYPVVNTAEVDNRVDEAAEAFIKKFYSQLKKQK